MTSLRFGLSVCMAGLLATGCPADDGEDDSSDDAAMTSTPGSESGGESGSESGTPADSSGNVPSDLSHATDIQPIWDEHCTEACHEPGGAWVSFVDLSDSAYDDIVGVAVLTVPGLNHIESGDPDASYIWHKLQNTQLDVAGNGAQMPYPQPGMAATVLTQEQLDTIEAWIIAGAPE